LLEALFLLGRGRSFRTRNSERSFARATATDRVWANRRNATSGGGCAGSQAEGTTARINGATAGSLTELSHLSRSRSSIPVFTSSWRKAVFVGVGGWIWAVFHVEHGFADLWVRYTRAVKQRNAALRHQPAQAAAWDPEVARLGELIAEARRGMLEQMQAGWRESVAALSGLDVDLHYSRAGPRMYRCPKPWSTRGPRPDPGAYAQWPSRADGSCALGTDDRPARFCARSAETGGHRDDLAQLRLLQERNRNHSDPASRSIPQPSWTGPIFRSSSNR